MSIPLIIETYIPELDSSCVNLIDIARWQGAQEVLGQVAVYLRNCQLFRERHLSKFGMAENQK